jgi:F0F1-type ATP synthase assembly protein I
LRHENEELKREVKDAKMKARAADEARISQEMKAAAAEQVLIPLSLFNNNNDR